MWFAAVALVVMAPSAAAPVGARDEVIIATSTDVPSVTSPDGTRRYEVPWLRSGDRDVAVAPDAMRMAFTSDRDGNPEIYVAAFTTGDVRRITASPEEDRRPAWSPDGTRLAWDVAAPDGREVVVAQADGTAVAPFAAAAGDDLEPTWSADGTQIAFMSDRSGSRQLWRGRLTGGPVEALTTSADVPGAPAWSPDGSRIAFARDGHVWTLDALTGDTRVLTRGRVVDTSPEWSPDGSAIAFSRATGRYSAVHVVPAGGGSVRIVGGTADQLDPDWSRAGALLSTTPELLPDLDQRAPTGVQVVFRDGAYRLGFDSRTENVGDGALWLRGGAVPGGQMRADQLITLRSGGTRRVRNIGRMLFEAHEPHSHWHLKNYVRYELRRAADFSFVASDRKSGFCLVDRYGRTLARVPGVRPPRFVGDCASLRPDATETEMGNSRGYADIYPALFHGQDVPLGGISAGLYVLVQRANPSGRIRETRYGNNAASVRVRLTRTAGVPRITVLRRCEDSAVCLAG